MNNVSSPNQPAFQSAFSNMRMSTFLIIVLIAAAVVYANFALNSFKQRFRMVQQKENVEVQNLTPKSIGMNLEHSIVLYP